MEHEIDAMRKVPRKKIDSARTVYRLGEASGLSPPELVPWHQKKKVDATRNVWWGRERRLVPSLFPGALSRREGRRAQVPRMGVSNGKPSLEGATWREYKIWPRAGLDLHPIIPMLSELGMKVVWVSLGSRSHFGCWPCVEGEG